MCVGVLAKLPNEGFVGIHLNDYSVDIATAPCKNDARTYGQIMKDLWSLGGGSGSVSCTPNVYSDGISGKPSGGDRSGNGGGGPSDYEEGVDSSSTGSYMGSIVQSLFTVFCLFIAFFLVSNQ